MNEAAAIESAENIIATLAAKRAAIKNRVAEIDRQRGMHSYDAIVGEDEKAKRLIASLATEAVELDQEAASIDAALDTAKQKLEAAQRVEKVAATKKAAAEAVRLYRRLGAIGKTMDEHMAAFAMAASESQRIVNELHSLGFAMPSHAQMDTFSALACGATLMNLP
jgi:hypothetical protein